MKPNMFIHGNYCREDFFSMSLAYIANMFPAIGRGLVQRIAVLAGKRPDYFGEFEQCEFVGREFPDGHRSSRPDLKILCTRRTVYFENKLDSPLSFSQMQRHADFIGRDGKCRLVFVSNIQHRSSSLRSLPQYLHPKDTDHYLWLDFRPVFCRRYRGNSTGGRILADFNAALNANGMIGRTLKGARGSLYTPNSDASHLALRQLWDVLDDIGFRLAGKSAQESTIRAYPSKLRQYPLLNPRFCATATRLDDAWDKECLVFTVLSKGHSTTIIDRQLAKYRSTQERAFIDGPFESTDGYYYHGHFLLPLSFTGTKRGNTQIDFAPLRQPLAELLEFLKGCKS